MQSGDKHEELVASRARIDCDRLRDDRLQPETLPWRWDDIDRWMAFVIPGVVPYFPP